MLNVRSIFGCVESRRFRVSNFEDDVHQRLKLLLLPKLQLHEICNPPVMRMEPSHGRFFRDIPEHVRMVCCWWCVEVVTSLYMILSGIEL